MRCLIYALELMNYADVVVDGQYIDAVRNPSLKWKGSDNQRVIDVKKSLKEHNVSLLEQ